MTLRLFLLQPAIVFQAEVSVNPIDPDYPVNQIQFDAVSLGAYTDIEPGMTVLLGSAAGKADHGVQRIRKAATVDTIFIGRTSRGFGYGEISPIGDSHITVVDLRMVWVKPPIIDIDLEETTVDIFKDSDIAYTDQTLNIPPVANLGPGTMDEISAGIITVDFDSVNSFAVADGATLSSYLWDVGDGTITVGTSASAAITATFPAGFRYVSLQVTDSNGKTHKAYCPVLAIDPAADTTIKKFQITRHRFDQEGQELSANIYEDIPRDTYPDNTLVMIADGLPSSAADRSHMMFIGWHHADYAEHSGKREGYIRESNLDFLDVAGKMKNLHGYSQEIRHVPNEEHASAVPSHWGVMPNPNMDKYMHYLLQWGSNVLDLADWTWSGTGSTYAFHIRDNDDSLLWDQLKQNANLMVPTYMFTCNTLGQLRVIVDPMIEAGGSRTSTIQATISEDQWESLTFDYQRYPPYFWLWGGAVVSGTSLDADGRELTIFCKAPGIAPGIGTNEMRKEQGLCPSQSILNTSMGNLYARISSPYKLHRITLIGGSDLDIEPADMTWIQLTMGFDAESAFRGDILNVQRGLPLEVSIRYNNSRSGLVRTIEILYERETVGVNAVTYTPPKVDFNPNEDDWWPPGYFEDNPGSVVPTLSPPPIIPAGAQQFAFFSAAGNLYKTSDLQTPSGSGGPTWTETVLGLSASNTPIFDFVVDPFSPGYLGTGTDINGYFVTESSIYKIEDIFGTPTLTLLHTFPNGNAASGQWRTIDASFGRFFSEQSDNPWIIVVSYYHDEAGHEGTWAIYSQDAGQTWSTETQISQHYTTQSSSVVYPEFSVWASPRVPGRALTVAYTSTSDTNNVAMYETLDWGASWSLFSPSITSANRFSPAIHVPWHDNADEAIMYWGYVHRSIPNDHKLYRRDSSDSNLEISFFEEYAPDEFRSYGLCRKWGIRSSDIDRRSMIYAGRGNDTTAATSGDKFLLAISNNGGDTWTVLEFFSGLTRSARMAAFMANSDVEYIALGRNMYVGYSAVGGVPDDRSGNLQVLNGGNVFVRGFCGGLS